MVSKYNKSFNFIFSFRKMKKILAYIIASLIIFINISMDFFTVPVKASILDDFGISWEQIINAINNGEIEEGTALDFWEKSLGVSGFIYRNKDNWASWLASQLLSYSTGGTSFGDSNTPESEVIENGTEYLVNNISNSGNSYTFNDNSRNLLTYIANAYMNESGYKYVYSHNILNSVSSFSDGVYFSALRRLISNQQSNNYCFLCDGSNYVWCVPKSSNICCVLYGYDHIPYVGVYNQETWVQYSTTNYGTLYEYHQQDNTVDEFVLDERGTSVALGKLMVKDYDIESNGMFDNYAIRNAYQWFVSNGEVSVMKMYLSVADMKEGSQGVAPYYTTSNWSNFVSNSGNYTIDSSNSNNITYGDVTNYVNNYYTENNDYPNDNQVQNYIDINISNDDNGGGSGGGSTNNGSTVINNSPVFNNNNSFNINIPTLSSDSVSGNGGSGSSGGIFDWLGSIGKTLGNLIKGLGELISNLFEGIVETVTTVLQAIPNILTPLISYIFGGLPEELQAVLTLGITCVVMIAVIKAIKG